MERRVAVPGLDIHPKLHIPRMSSTPHELYVPLRGDEASLKRFCATPVLAGSFIRSGYSLRVATLNFSMSLFVKGGFHHLLTGDAKWEELSEIEERATRGEFETNRAITTGTTTSNWVTRQQLRDLSTSVVGVVRGVVVLPEKPNDFLNGLADKIVTELVTSPTGQRVAKLVELNNEYVIDPALLEELGADRYNVLNASLKARLVKRQMRSRKKLMVTNRKPLARVVSTLTRTTSRGLRSVVA